MNSTSKAIEALWRWAEGSGSGMLRTVTAIYLLKSAALYHQEHSQKSLTWLFIYLGTGSMGLIPSIHKGFDGIDTQE